MFGNGFLVLLPRPMWCGSAILAAAASRSGHRKRALGAACSTRWETAGETKTAPRRQVAVGIASGFQSQKSLGANRHQWISGCSDGTGLARISKSPWGGCGGIQPKGAEPDRHGVAQHLACQSGGNPALFVVQLPSHAPFICDCPVPFVGLRVRAQC